MTIFFNLFAEFLFTSLIYYNNC